MSTETLINPQLTHRFNAAAWHREEDQTTVLIAREVLVGGDGVAEPDKGDIVLLEIDASGRVTHEDVVWRHEGASFLLEDPRALVLADGRVRVGLTAVGRDCSPYPAVITFDNKFIRSHFPEASLIPQLGPGKNTTPIKDDVFFYRPEKEGYCHRLVEFSWDGRQTAVLSEIDFPKCIPWASWKMGTTMPPFWINDDEALMIIHGIKIENGRYVYSLGRARLYRAGSGFSAGKYQVEVDEKPILTPDDFLNEDGSPMIEDLHPNLRRVVYACGGVLKKQLGQQVLALYVNVGDRQTVEVCFPWKNLTDGWGNGHCLST